MLFYANNNAWNTWFCQDPTGSFTIQMHGRRQSLPSLIWLGPPCLPHYFLIWLTSQPLLSNIYPISYGCTVFLHTFTTICLDGNTFWLIGPNLLNNPDCTVWLSFVSTSVFHQPSLIYDLWFCDFFSEHMEQPMS